jgi:hypothetical protein
MNALNNINYNNKKMNTMSCQIHIQIELNQLETILGEQFQLVMSVADLDKLVLELTRQDNLQARNWTNGIIRESLRQIANFLDISDNQEDCQQLLKDKQDVKRKRQGKNNSSKNNQLSLVYSQETSNCSGIGSSYQNLSFEREPELTSDANHANHGNKKTKNADEKETERDQAYVLSLAEKAGLSGLNEKSISVFCNLLCRLQDMKFKEIYRMPDEKLIKCLKQLVGQITLGSLNSGANGGIARNVAFDTGVAIILCSNLNICYSVVRNFVNIVHGFHPDLNPEYFDKKYLSRYSIKYPQQLRQFFIDMRDTGKYQERNKFNARCYATLDKLLLFLNHDLSDINKVFKSDIIDSLFDS